MDTGTEGLVLPRLGPENVRIKMVGNILTIEVDISKPLGKTKDKKSTLVGSTRGVATLTNGLRVSLNVTRD